MDDGRSSADHPAQRASDATWRVRVWRLVAGRARRVRRENWYRDVWLFVVSGLVLFALLEWGSTLGQVQAGRRTAARLTCATTSAIIAAGRQTILAGAAPQPAPFEAHLESLGFPPLPVRREAARAAARAYARSIAVAVEDQFGPRGAKLVNADGTLNCRLIGRFVHA